MPTDSLYLWADSEMRSLSVPNAVEPPWMKFTLKVWMAIINIGVPSGSEADGQAKCHLQASVEALR